MDITADVPQAECDEEWVEDFRALLTGAVAKNHICAGGEAEIINVAARVADAMAYEKALRRNKKSEEPTPDTLRPSG